MEPPALVPRPAKLVLLPGEVVIGPEVGLEAPAEAAGAVELWSSLIGRASGCTPRRCDPGDGTGSAGRGAAEVVLALVPRPSPGGAESTSGRTATGSEGRSGGNPGAPGRPGDEGYRLLAAGGTVRVEAGSPAGLCNAAHTFRQLLPAGFELPAAGRRQLRLASVEIEDAPRFSWRGAHLDLARHVLPLPFLFRFVDLMALHKLNVLHLHLTDDQGWRLPVDGWPRLATVASWRRETLVGHARAEGGPARFDGTPHGGSYEPAALAALAAYGAARNVMVMPEVDLPGHVQAAIAAYPELGEGPPVEVMTSWGISERVLSLSEEAMRFCADVVAQLARTFPSPYLHLGGDECPQTQWRQSPAAAARAAALGLSGPEGLQGWFTGEVAALVAAEGRRLVGWDEIVEAGPLPPGTTVMSWRGEEGGVAAASAGFDVVMCPEQPCYFDRYQSDGVEEPLAFGGLNTLADVYAYDPVPAELDHRAATHILGTQFQLWSEYLPSARDVEYMAFPRAAALAEVAWSGPGGDFDDFSARLGALLARLELLGVNFRPPEGPRPWQRAGSGARRRPAPSAGAR